MLPELKIPKPTAMSEFKVKEIVSGNVIKTVPNWKWINRDGIEFAGDEVHVAGYKINSDNADVAKNRLETLLTENYVVLSSPKVVYPDRRDVVECVVQLNGVDISTYFPEFKG